MRILILCASTGGGHIRAANALKTIITEKNENDIVEVVDCLEYVSHRLNKTVSKGYLHMATKAPGLYGALYKSTNKDNTLNSVVSTVTSRYSRRLLPLIAKFKPDAVVATHAFAGEMISALKGKYDLDLPVISIMTDFAPHQAYIHKYIDCYVVSNDDMIHSVKNLGIPPYKIKSIGIPIDTAFYNSVDRNKVCREMELDPAKPIVLIMAGSFGVTDILKIYQNISLANVDFQIIVITGKNPKLFKAFSYLLEKSDSETKERKLTEVIKDITLLKSLSGSFEPTKPTKLLYYTNEVQKFMHISDLIVTKPGGLTVSEALASTLPMAIFKAFPGQEEENSDFLVKNNLAVKLSKSNCKEVIENLLNNPEELNKMRESCRRLYKDKSAENVYLIIKELIEEYH